MFQIGRGKRDNLGKFSILLLLKVYCNPSLEPSHRDSSNEGSQHMFSLRNKEKLCFNNLQYPLLFGALVSCVNLRRLQQSIL